MEGCWLIAINKMGRKKDRKIGKRMEEIIKIPDDIKIELNNGIKISGKKGELIKKNKDKDIKLERRNNEIVIFSQKNSKRLKKKIGSLKAHIKNMIKGVREIHFYKLKICASHFPMNVSIEHNKFIVKNFIGEKIPRILKLNKDSSIKLEGSEILVESCDKDAAAQTAADIEQLCRIKNRDKRVFQDGIFIINKCGKEIK